MPTIGWIDALRQYNAGMPSWCVPRKGTPGYDMVMRIRQGEKPKSFKELTAELERKTGGKPKTTIKRTMTVSLAEDEQKQQTVRVPTIADEAPKMERKESTQKMSQQKTMGVIQPTNVAEGGSNELASIYFSQVKSDGHFLLWKVKGDTAVQLADVYLTKTPEHPGGFVKTQGRTRKVHRQTISGKTFLSYLTPEQKNPVSLTPLADLPANRLSFGLPWLQRETMKGLHDLGFKGDVKFTETPTKEQLEAEPEPLEGEGVTHRTKPKKEKRVDTPEVLALLDEKKRLKDEQTDLVRRRDAKEFPSNDPAYHKRLDEIYKRTIEIDPAIRKLRLAQTKAKKIAEGGSAKKEVAEKKSAKKEEKSAEGKKTTKVAMKKELKEVQEKLNEAYSAMFKVQTIRHDKSIRLQLRGDPNTHPELVEETKAVREAEREYNKLSVRVLELKKEIAEPKKKS